MKFGVCIIALGYEIYGSYALNLALSLKAYQPNLKIALLYEPQAIAHLTAKEKSFFDHFIEIPESDFLVNGAPQYQRVKLLVHRYTPFEYTFYMDGDNIFLDKKVNWLFGECFQSDFKIGWNGHYDLSTGKRPKNYTFWCEDVAASCKYFGVTYLPQTVSGFYYFRKCSWTDDLFEEAVRIYDDQKAPAIKWANGKADEYCFNFALAKLGYTQEDFHVFYFDKINGHMESQEVYNKFWGIATGGNRIAKNLIVIYNRLVDKYCTKLGVTTRRYHVNKCDVVPERKMF